MLQVVVTVFVLLIVLGGLLAISLSRGPGKELKKSCGCALPVDGKKHEDGCGCT